VLQRLREVIKRFPAEGAATANLSVIVTNVTITNANAQVNTLCASPPP
jgi:hypothetical protein